MVFRLGEGSPFTGVARHEQQKKQPLQFYICNPACLFRRSNVSGM